MSQNCFLDQHFGSALVYKFIVKWNHGKMESSEVLLFLK